MENSLVLPSSFGQSFNNEGNNSNGNNITPILMKFFSKNGEFTMAVKLMHNDVMTVLMSMYDEMKTLNKWWREFLKCKFFDKALGFIKKMTIADSPTKDICEDLNKVFSGIIDMMWRSEAVRNFFERFGISKEHLKNFSETLSEIICLVVHAYSIFCKLKPVLKELGKDLLEFGQNILRFLWKGIETLCKSLFKLGQNIYEFGKTKLGLLKNNIKTLGQNIYEFSTTKLGSFNKGIGTLGQKFSNIGHFLKKGIIALGKGIAKFGLLKKVFWGLLKFLLLTPVGWVISAVVVLTVLIVKFRKQIGDFFKWVGSKIAAMGKAVGKFFVGIVRGILSIAGRFAQFFMSIGRGVANIVAKFVNFFTDIIERIKGIGTSVADSILSAVRSVKDKIVDVFTSVVSSIREAFDRFIASLRRKLNSLKFWKKNKDGELKDEIAKAREKIEGNFALKWFKSDDFRKGKPIYELYEKKRRGEKLTLAEQDKIKEAQIRFLRDQDVNAEGKELEKMLAAFKEAENDIERLRGQLASKGIETQNKKLGDLVDLMKETLENSENKEAQKVIVSVANHKKYNVFETLGANSENNRR